MLGQELGQVQVQVLEPGLGLGLGQGRVQGLGQDLELVQVLAWELVQAFFPLGLGTFFQMIPLLLPRKGCR